MPGDGRGFEHRYGAELHGVPGGKSRLYTPNRMEFIMRTFVFFSFVSVACSNSVPADSANNMATPSTEETSSGDANQSSSDESSSDESSSGESSSDESSSDEETASETDMDSDGWSADVDCDDNDDRIHPAAVEYCDGIDTNCDGVVDPPSSLGATDWYLDSDDDGFGDADHVQQSCTAPGPTWVSNEDDCDDTSSLAYPGADEVCDGIDNSCDGVIDPDTSSDAPVWFFDGDGDSFGLEVVQTRACLAPSVEWSDNGLDCDDTDENVFPGAYEFCDGIDSDCDGLESDGIATFESVSGDPLDVTTLLEGGVYIVRSEGELHVCEGDWTSQIQVEFDSAMGMSSPSGPEIMIVGHGDVSIDAAGRGSVIEFDDSVDSAEIRGLSLSGGASTMGGGVRAEDLDLLIEDVVFDGNEATRQGGALSIQSGTLELHDVAFRENKTTGYHTAGGAIFMDSGELVGSNLVFSSNETVLSGTGGAIHMGRGSVSLSDSRATANIATNSGGALYVGRGNIELIDTELNWNHANFRGGAVWVSGDLTMMATLIEENSAGDNGGAVYMSTTDGDVTLLCDAEGAPSAGFLSNDAGGYGGAVAFTENTGHRVESIECDWGTGGSDNSSEDIGMPYYRVDASNDATFICDAIDCSDTVATGYRW
jgi:predicted outer membrane repeat protein